MRNALTFGVVVSVMLFGVGGCTSILGTYEAKAFDAKGRPLMGNLSATANGRDIKAAKDSLCAMVVGKKAVIRVYNVSTGEELLSESPYFCRK